MSVIVQSEDGCIKLFTKGAETTIMRNVTSGPLDVTNQHLTDYAMVSTNIHKGWICPQIYTLTEVLSQLFRNNFQFIME